MACCIVGALIISQILSIWAQFRRLLGLGSSPSAAGWSPSTQAEPPDPAIPRGPGRLRVVLFVGSAIALGATIGFGQHHVLKELREAAVALHMMAPPPESEMCIPATS